MTTNRHFRQIRNDQVICDLELDISLLLEISAVAVDSVACSSGLAAKSQSISVV